MTHPLTPREKVENALYSMEDWRQASPEYLIDNMLTALASGSGDHDPVAWRVKDFADGWIVCGAEQTAVDLAAAMGGATVQSLYGPALIAENAALQAEADKLDEVSEQCSRWIAAHDEQSERATEAERKLAEAVGLLRRIEGMCPATCETSLAHDMAQIASAWLSKESERG